jgi:Domain of unknown function (DUF5666)
MTMKKLGEIALLLSAALLSLNLAACEPAAAAPSAAPTPHDGSAVNTPPSFGVTGFDPGSFQEGRVVKLDGKTIRIATANEEVDLELSSSTVVWDGIIWVANIPTEAGDFVTAWGVWNPDHSFAVQKLYVNIVNLQGRASNVSRGTGSGSFVIVDQYGKTQRVIVAASSEIYEGGAGSGSRYGEKPVLPQNGEDVQVIGREMKDGSVLAVNLSLP